MTELTLHQRLDEAWSDYVNHTSNAPKHLFIARDVYEALKTDPWTAPMPLATRVIDSYKDGFFAFNRFDLHKEKPASPWLADKAIVERAQQYMGEFDTEKTLREACEFLEPGSTSDVAAPVASALNRQEGGSHYKDLAIQPVEYITKNRLDYLSGNVIKYVTRHAAKGGREDLEKAKHYIDLILELCYDRDA